MVPLLLRKIDSRVVTRGYSPILPPAPYIYPGFSPSLRSVRWTQIASPDVRDGSGVRL